MTRSLGLALPLAVGAICVAGCIVGAGLTEDVPATAPAAAAGLTPAPSSADRRGMDSAPSAPAAATSAPPVAPRPPAATPSAERPAQPGAADDAAQAAAFVRVLPPNPKAPREDGLERPVPRTLEWQVAQWGNPGHVSTWLRSGASTDVVAVVKLGGGKAGKVAVERPCRMRLAPTGTIALDVYNGTARAVPVAVAFYASRDRVYSESIAQPSRPAGWTHIEFDLAAKTWKRAPEWKHNSEVWGRDQVTDIVVLFYDDGEGWLAMDAIHADLSPEPPASTDSLPGGAPPTFTHRVCLNVN
jgi:hypothetical protein